MKLIKSGSTHKFSKQFLPRRSLNSRVLFSCSVTRARQCIGKRRAVAPWSFSNHASFDSSSRHLMCQPSFRCGRCWRACSTIPARLPCWALKESVRCSRCEVLNDGFILMYGPWPLRIIWVDTTSTSRNMLSHCILCPGHVMSFTTKVFAKWKFSVIWMEAEISVLITLEFNHLKK